MKAFFQIAIILIASSSLVSADCSNTGGNQQCFDDLKWTATSGVEIGGDTSTFGQSDAMADGVGKLKKADSWTFQEGVANMETRTTLTSDNIANCTNCGDNQVHFLVDSKQRTIAGASHEASSDEGGVSSTSSGTANSSLSGFTWGRSAFIRP